MMRQENCAGQTVRGWLISTKPVLLSGGSKWAVPGASNLSIGVGWEVRQGSPGEALAGTGWHHEMMGISWHSRGKLYAAGQQH